jgi:hypothetical protein
MQTECVREQDVLDAVSAGRWPVRRSDRIDAELRDHIEGCPVCQDVASVFAAISDDRELAWKEAVVPPASVVWWRAQIRAREEAARAAGRPIAIAQGVAVGGLVAAALALVPFAFPWVIRASAAISDLAAWLTPRAEAVSNAFALVTGIALPLLPFAVASIVLAPILLYYALTEE